MNFLDMHMLQTVPANNINRGSYGEVKTTEYGGVIRHKPSSQSWKRPVRMTINEWCKENGYTFGIFSRRFSDEFKKQLESEGIVIENLDKILIDLGLLVKKNDTDAKKPKDDDQDQNQSKEAPVMYLSDKEYDIIYEALKTGNVYKEKKTKKGVEQITKSLADLLTDAGCRNPYEIATFGRMFAGNTELNIASAIRMNHPMSTHAITREVDYFTAVDQLDPNGGSAHINTFEFTTSTLYRYVGINLDQLARNMQGNDYKEYLRILIKTFVMAFPSGKCNSMNATTRPSYVGFTLAKGSPHQLCDAFEQAIPATDEGFVAPSIRKLKEYRKNDELSGMDEIILSTEWEKNKGININDVINSVITAIV